MAIIRITNLPNGDKEIKHERLNGRPTRPTVRVRGRAAQDREVDAALSEYLEEESVVVYYEQTESPKEKP